MKKNLLSLALILSAGIYTSAQNTYINDAVIVKVNPNTLFFHGGDVTITNTSGDTKKIINDGNIQIAGNFSNTSTTGKNFVNTYTDGSNFGQLIIDQNKNVTGRVTLERANIIDNGGQYYGMGLPFTGSIQTLFNNMLGWDGFIGACPIGDPCQAPTIGGYNVTIGRYAQTTLLWDIAKTEYANVPIGENIKPGGNYTFNVFNEPKSPLRAFIDYNSANNIKSFPIYGTPNNKAFQSNNTQSGIIWYDASEWNNKTWSEWKSRTNSYNERYETYLSNGTNMDASKIYAKNLHRFTNPFTSNLDLSNVSKTNNNSWVSFNNIPGGAQFPTEVYDNYLRFRVNKLTDKLVVNWYPFAGGSNQLTSGTDYRISAYLTATGSNYVWVGNPDALIIKPFEYFEIDYYAINTGSNNTNSRIVSANYNLTDTNKTFNYDFGINWNSTTNQSTDDLVFSRSVNEKVQKLLTDPNLIERGLVTPNDFTQLELFLTKDNTFVGEAAYLINGNFYTTGSNITPKINDNSIILYEESTNGDILKNSQTLINEFNSTDYIGKPLGIGFNNLINGESYSIKLRLFEYSILNRVGNLNIGTYYLLDKQTNTISEINANTSIDFIADENINSRYEIYWNEVPRTLNTNENELLLANTYVYTNNNAKYVRFETKNITANIKIYDILGRLISTYEKIDTSSDFKLNLNTKSNMYIIDITYANGKNVTKKLIN